MTYNHPFWDPPQADETTAAPVQKGLKAKKASIREKLYLSAVAALYKDAGAGTKSARDENYRDAMAAVCAKYPDDETKLFYGLSILGAIPEGNKGFERQGQAAKLFEEVYAHQPDHPGVLHYLIHAYDDPEHATLGLKAAHAYCEGSARRASCSPYAIAHFHEIRLMGGIRGNQPEGLEHIGRRCQTLSTSQVLIEIFITSYISNTPTFSLGDIAMRSTR